MLDLQTYITRKPLPGSLSRHSQRIDMFNAYRPAYQVSWCMWHANNVDLLASVNIMEITRGKQSITNTVFAKHYGDFVSLIRTRAFQCLNDCRRVKYYASRSNEHRDRMDLPAIKHTSLTRILNVLINDFLRRATKRVRQSRPPRGSMQHNRSRCNSTEIM